METVPVMREHDMKDDEKKDGKYMGKGGRMKGEIKMEDGRGTD